MKMIKTRIDLLPSSLGGENPFRTLVCTKEDLARNKNSSNLKLAK
jgi:hypothetical protein